MVEGWLAKCEALTLTRLGAESLGPYAARPALGGGFPRAEARPGSTGLMCFVLLFTGVFGALIAVIVAAFYGQGAGAWAIGFLYVGYDVGLQVALLVSAWLAVMRPATNPASDVSPSLAVLVPCRNEALVLPACVAALQPQLEPGDRLLVVDDGSIDGSAVWCHAHGVEVLAKPNSGKSDSLNQALGLVDQEVVVTIDADTVIKPGSLAAIRVAFRDPRLVAAGGLLEVVTRPALLGRWLGWHQRAEYLRSFLWRSAWEKWGTLLLISGAFAAYRRTALVSVGGLATRSHAEDYEITHRLHRASLDGGHDWRLGMIPGAQAVTDAPATIRLFLAQRTRWFSGFISVHLAYRDLVGARRAKALGLIMLPIKTCDLLLPIYGLFAIAVLIAFYAFGFNIPSVIIWVLFAKLAFDLAAAVVAVYLMRRWAGWDASAGPRLASILAATACEPFAYQMLRQLAALLGWISFLRRRTNWTPQR